jgi:hypothetical protein
MDVFAAVAKMFEAIETLMPSPPAAARSTAGGAAGAGDAGGAVPLAALAPWGGQGQRAPLPGLVGEPPPPLPFSYLPQLFLPAPPLPVPELLLPAPPQPSQPPPLSLLQQLLLQLMPPLSPDGRRAGCRTVTTANDAVDVSGLSQIARALKPQAAPKPKPKAAPKRKASTPKRPRTPRVPGAAAAEAGPGQLPKPPGGGAVPGPVAVAGLRLTALPNWELVSPGRQASVAATFAAAHEATASLAVEDSAVLARSRAADALAAALPAATPAPPPQLGPLQSAAPAVPAPVPSPQLGLPPQVAPAPPPPALPPQLGPPPQVAPAAPAPTPAVSLAALRDAVVAAAAEGRCADVVAAVARLADLAVQQAAQGHALPEQGAAQLFSELLGPRMTSALVSAVAAAPALAGHVRAALQRAGAAAAPGVPYYFFITGLLLVQGVSTPEALLAIDPAQLAAAYQLPSAAAAALAAARRA